MTLRIPEELDVERLNKRGRVADVVETNRSRCHRLRAAGICVRGASHGPAAPGHSLCEPCRVDANHEQLERYRRFRRVSRVNSCTRCGGEDHNARRCSLPPAQQSPSAKRRAERDREYKALLRLRGQCLNNPAHPKPAKGRARCDACNAKRRKGSAS